MNYNKPMTWKQELVKILPRAVLVLIALLAMFFIGKWIQFRDTPVKRVVVTEVVAVKEPTDQIFGINVLVDLTDVSHEKIILKKIKVTTYNNEERQTSSTPNTMASNRHVYQGAIGVSQDIVDKYKPKFGDYVCISPDGRYLKEKACFFYEDHMAYARKPDESKKTKNVDIFFYNRRDNFSIPEATITIYKVHRNQ